MTLPIDPATGRPAGPARQVTLEGSAAFFDVSPDGEWIAYTPHDRELERRVIRVVPSTGGATRLVADAATSIPVWAPDGESVYYGIMAAGPDWRGMAMVRTALNGSRTDTVFRWPGVLMPARFPGNGYLLRTVDPAWPQSMDRSILWELTTVDGRPLARFRLPGGMWPGPFVRGEPAFLTSRSDAAAPLQVLPVNGGTPVRLGDARSTDKPVAWTPDGRAVLYRTHLNGADVLMLAPVDGGSTHQLPVPGGAAGDWGPRHPASEAAFRPAFSPDGEHLLYQEADPEAGRWSLHVLDLATEQSRTLAEDAVPVPVRGRGGTPYIDGDAFIWVEKESDGYVLWSAGPDGDRRRLRGFGPEAGDHPVSQDGHPDLSLAVHGSRVALVEWSESETRLRVARSLDEPLRVVARVAGGLAEPSWSPDGRTLAAVHYPPDGGARVVFFDLDTGDLAGRRFTGEPMLADSGLAWLPDGRAVLAADLDDADIWMLSRAPDEDPVSLTAEEPGDIYDFILSPDGRQVAYGARVSLPGSSIWRVDIEIEGAP